ncbi:MAG: protease pro-enzyme activation domain-containing protein, partial [Ginsengibacter sp.]
MEEQSNFKLAGSYKPLPLNPNDIISEADKSREVDVTVMLRRKMQLPPGLLKGKSVSRKNYEKNYSASKADADLVEVFAHNHNLSTVEVNLAARRVILKGTAGDFETAFSTNLQAVNNFMALTKEVQIP